MDKPVTIAYREFKDRIIEAINSSGLPAFCIVPVLEQALAEVKEIEEKQYATDKAAYEEGKDNGQITEA